MFKGSFYEEDETICFGQGCERALMISPWAMNPATQPVKVNTAETECILQLSPFDFWLSSNG